MVFKDPKCEYILNSLHNLDKLDHSNCVNKLTEWFKAHQDVLIRDVKREMTGLYITLDAVGNYEQLSMFDALLWFLSYDQNVSRNISLDLL